MRILKVLHRTLFDSVPSIHQTRSRALAATVGALLNGAFLTVTALGRGLDSAARTKHNIKRVDRLASNPHLQCERLSLYRALCHRLCQHLPQPVIIIDWSDIIQQQRLMLIRAALVLDGRAIPLYEAAYPLKHYNKPRTHKRFLMELSTLLPAHCIPIIVTDAGFRGPWFKAVEALGWHWIGRVRKSSTIGFYPVKRGVKPQTCTIAPALNPVISAPPNCRLNRPISAISICTKSVSSIKKPTAPSYTSPNTASSETFAEQQRQPWLIATNLSPQLFSPKDMVKRLWQTHAGRVLVS